MKVIYLVRFSLLLTVCVIMLGTYTRLADAGLGCPDWPGCYGHMTVPSSTQQLMRADQLFPGLTVDAPKAWLEMIHRYFAGTLGIVVFLITALSLREKSIPKTLPVMISVLVVFQALLGMWTVTLKLMPLVVMGHLLGGFTLLCALSFLHWLLTQSIHRDSPVAASSSLRFLALGTLLIVVGQIAIGGWTSSNYAALMCTDLPICEGNWVQHLDFRTAFTPVHFGHDSYEFGVLEYGARMTIHVTHRIGALLTMLMVLTLAYHCFRHPSGQLRTAAIRLSLVLAMQILLGVSNVMFSLPLLNAVAHNLGAAVLLVMVLHTNYLLRQPDSVPVLNKESIQ